MITLRCLHKIVLPLFLWLILFVAHVLCIGEVIYAVNCGGEAHTDAQGVVYQRDTHNQGIASDYGRSMLIQRVPPQDQVIYQTERYALSSFYYEVPITKDGNYVLWLKFSEVWFAQPNQKVFNVMLNDEHTVVEGLDIFLRAGRGIAHDEYVPFSVKGGQLHAGGHKSALPSDRKLKIEFVKLDRDNPKVNAIIIMKGTLDDVPKLPALPGKPDAEEEEEDEVEEEVKPKPQRKSVTSGPKVQDPYAADDTSSMMLPVLIAIGAFIPVVFCLCRL